MSGPHAAVCLNGGVRPTSDLRAMDSSMRELTATFEEKSEEVSLLMDRLKGFAELPSLRKGRFVPADGSLCLALTWGQRDVRKGRSLAMQTYQSIFPTVGSPCPAAALRSELMWVETASDGQSSAQVVTHKEEGTKETSYHVEIWRSTGRTKTVDVTALDVHGDVFDNDGTFGAMAWSSCGTQLLYVAEAKKPKTRKFFMQESQDSEGGDKSKKDSLYETHQHKELYGDALGTKEFPVACVLDIKKETVTVLPLHESVRAVSCPVWSPGDRGIVYTGLIHCPYQLGLIYCYQRRSALFYYDLEQKTTVPLTPLEGRSVSCPRFSPDGKKMVYLDREELGPHFKSDRVMVMDWDTKESSMLLDCPRRVTNLYAGLYLDLTDKCWAEDSDRIIFSTHYKSLDYVYVLSTNTGKLSRLPFPKGHTGSMVLEDVCNDYLLAVCSLIGTEYFLVYGKLPPAGLEETFEWKKVPGSSVCDNALPIDVTVKMTTLKCTPENPDYPDMDFEYTLVAPKNRSKDCPLLIIPHGGPHSRCATGFAQLPSGLAQCGFALAMVNYRGSVGFGEDCVNSLPGHVGDLDVKDVQNATEHVLRTEGFNPEKVGVLGGSHGGFLGGHLIAQYPDTYKAACLICPVINIATMIGETDIPDWCYVECGLDFDYKQIPTAEICKKALEASPISLVDNVRCPVLLQSGLEDKRVPSAQPREFFKALRARGKNVCMLDYENDCHALSSVGTFISSIMYIMVFMARHLDVKCKDLFSNNTPQERGCAQPEEDCLMASFDSMKLRKQTGS